MRQKEQEVRDESLGGIREEKKSKTTKAGR